jgi:Ca2+-transporting ATPase
LNGIIGIWQESKAESTMQALKQMQSQTARVMRDGKDITEIPARDLVPGDIVELRTGDKVSADMRIAILKSATVRVQQASLTGESEPVSKEVESLYDQDIELQGKENMVFSGTTITNGNILCIVTNTGMDTELGKIQAQIQDATLQNYDSPLSRKLEEFSNGLTKFVGTICVIVWLVNYKYFVTWDGSGFPSVNLEQATYYFKVLTLTYVFHQPKYKIFFILLTAMYMEILAQVE